MTSQSGKQTIAIHILANISQSKGSHVWMVSECFWLDGSESACDDTFVADEESKWQFSGSSLGRIPDCIF